MLSMCISGVNPNSQPMPRQDSGQSASTADKWRTVAIETIGQKYIAQKQSYSNEGAVYSVVKINPQNNAGNLNVTYVEEVQSRFRINVQVLGERSTNQPVARRPISNQQRLGDGRRPKTNFRPEDPV